MSYTVNITSYVSPNYSARPTGMAISALVIHTTEGAWDSDAEWMCNPVSGVSTHYVIPPSGTVIYQLVADIKRAWHAGESSYQGRANWNDFSLGLEISHKQGQPWASGQKDRTAALCRDLIAAYHIPQAGIVAHRWIATPAGRKIDPTDWNDTDFKAWIASLYAPTTHTATAGPHGAIARQDYRAQGKAAAYFLPGTAIELDDFRQNEYRHAASGIGFIAEGDLL